MPVDVCLLLTPSDRKLVARAKRRGKKAGDQIIARIAARAATTAAHQNRKLEREIADDIDRVWPPPFLLKGSK